MKILSFFIITLFSFQLFSSEWFLNTGNKNKLEEYQRFFKNENETLSSTQEDLKEIDSDPISVVVHKASQMSEKTLVEDTSLEIEGENVGINIKWLLDDLNKYVNKKAVWTVLLAYKEQGKVYVFQGVVKGVIADSKGKSGFGFDQNFLPDGSQKTLAEEKPDHYNARFLAVKELLKNNPLTVENPIEDWKGPWQED